MKVYISEQFLKIYILWRKQPQTSGLKLGSIGINTLLILVFFMGMSDNNKNIEYHRPSPLMSECLLDTVYFDFSMVNNMYA